MESPTLDVNDAITPITKTIAKIIENNNTDIAIDPFDIIQSMQ